MRFYWRQRSKIKSSLRCQGRLKNSIWQTLFFKDTIAFCKKSNSQPRQKYGRSDAPIIVYLKFNKYCAIMRNLKGKAWERIS